MSMLAALVRGQDRMAAKGDAPVPGYSSEKIAYGVRLAAEGSVIDVVPLGEMVKGKVAPKIMTVPQPVKRTVGIAANLLLGKTAYVFGATDRVKQSKRAGKSHEKNTHPSLHFFRTRVKDGGKDLGRDAFIQSSLAALTYGGAPRSVHWFTRRPATSNLCSTEEFAGARARVSRRTPERSFPGPQCRSIQPQHGLDCSKILRDL
jgi:hypothetical protein